MLSEHTVAEAAAAAGIDAPAHYFDVTGSTNSELVRMAEEGSPEWTILVAGQQEAGRGRLGRTWLSDPGSSLLLSVLSRPALLPRDAAIVTLGAWVCRALSVDEACGVPARCKWPNDLVAGERK